MRKRRNFLTSRTVIRKYSIHRFSRLRDAAYISDIMRKKMEREFLSDHALLSIKTNEVLFRRSKFFYMTHEIQSRFVNSLILLPDEIRPKTNNFFIILSGTE